VQEFLALAASGELVPGADITAKAAPRTCFDDDFLVTDDDAVDEIL
jgi:hypothetical protein